MQYATRDGPTTHESCHDTLQHTHDTNGCHHSTQRQRQLYVISVLGTKVMAVDLDLGIPCLHFRKA